MRPIILIAALLTGCADLGPEEKSVVNQCLRVELFNNCMEKLPSGPLAVEYNDWEEVVSKCSSIGYYQSHRKAKYVPDECRSGGSD